MTMLNKTLNKTLIALATTALLSTAANASVNYDMGQAYVGAKVGQFNVDQKDVDVDNATAYGIYGGYNFDSNFGAEVEYLTSSDTDLKDGAAKGEYKASTLGAYGTYKYNFPNTGGLYAKGKLGMANVKLDVTYGNSSTKIDKTGVAGGLGLGFDVSPNFSIEGEYTRLPTIKDGNEKVDNNLMTIGAHFKF